MVGWSGWARCMAAGALALLCALPAGGIWAPRGASAGAVVIAAVASTNVYGDVIRQIGGSHVTVTTIINNPNADPHSYESSTTDAAAVARATLVVQNGLGYDDFMAKLEGASPNSRRVVYDVGAALGHHTGDNPHIWYDPGAMPRVAAFLAQTLTRQDPGDRAYFAQRLAAFDASLRPWTALIAAVRQRYAGTPVAITEPVFDYALAAMGLKVLTPPSFALAIMEGNDPAPQAVQFEKSLFTGNRVKCFFYNQQALSPVTTTMLGLARAHHVPIVGVYETEPARMTYQQWMLAEIRATRKALSGGGSSETL